MAEAVRFYWHGREVKIPLAEIPGRDRSPVQLRRSVVEAYAPDVVRQLQEGRFIAAAWESDGKISVILCHPNIAKTPADTLLVNARALPRVILRLQRWDEAPDATRLLLRAFGSQAATDEECAAARRQLVEWLTKHGQRDVAAVAEHFSAFPFGVRSDALAVINIWRHLLVKGQKDQIDRFLDKLENRFEGLGWARDQRYEDLLNRIPYQSNRFFCWVNAKGAVPRVMLSLNRAGDRRVRGGTYDLVDHPVGLFELAHEIQHVLTDVLEPAAAEAGLEVAYPHFEFSRVGNRTISEMTALAQEAEGRWPLSDELQPLWEKFVLTAVRDDVAINPAELTKWFVASGWSEKAAIELTNRFYADAARIGEHEEAGRQLA